MPVTEEGATERAFTGRYWNTKTPGTYGCVCCGQPLFESDTKYESGSSWPSFWGIFPRRPRAHRPALLHELGLAEDAPA